MDSILKDPALRVPTAQAQRVTLQFERIGVAVALGRVAESERLASQLAPTMAAAGARGTALYLQSVPAQTRTYFLGDEQAMARAADSLYSRSALDSLPVAERPYQGLGYAYAVAGRVDKVRQLQAEWTRVRPPEERSPADSVYWAAITAQAEGRWRDAAMAYDDYRARIKCPGCTLTDAARAWDRAGEADSALARYERSVTQMDVRSNTSDEAWTLAPTYKRLGEMYEAKGDRTKALAVLRRFRGALAGRRPGAAAAGQGRAGADGGAGWEKR